MSGTGGELRSVRAEPQRVQRLAGEIDLVVQMRTRGEAAAPGSRDHLSALDVLAVAHQESLVVAIGGDDAPAVVEDEDPAVDAVAAGAAHHSGGDGADRRPRRCSEIDSGMQAAAADERVLADAEQRSDA